MRDRSSAIRRFRMALSLASFLLAASALPVTIIVSSAADTLTGCSTLGTGTISGGGCTLRDAITFSNANPPTPPAQNLIQFNIPGSGVHTIKLQPSGPNNHHDLPPIVAATIVDGYSQPGASPNTLAIGDD